MKTNSQQTRQHILEIGYQLISAKGFTGVGLAQILKAAKVPKGSFYHYFASKEQFGEVLIQQYFDDYLTQLEFMFSSEKGNGYQRLMSYWQGWLATQADSGNMQKCLVVKLSAEVADLSEPMRVALLHGAQKIIAKLAEVIEQGVSDHSIAEQSAMTSAQMLYHMWLGASLMSKLQQSQQPLQHAMQLSKSQLAAK
jgi:TetR/AcrR family transcriptional regulator, transcriptional repressor for nem operon